MSDRKDRNFVQHSIDTGLDSLQGNPFLAQRILNQERTEQPVMKKKISFAFILAMALMLACAATAIAGAVSEDFNTWLYRIWPDVATTLMPVNMSCEDNGFRMEIISAVADGKELYITYSMEDLFEDRLSAECSPVLYVDSVPDYMWDASFEQPIKDKATGKIIFGEHFTYKGNISSPDNVLKAHIHNFTSVKQTSLADLFPYLEQYGSQVKAMAVPEGARALWRADVYGEPESDSPSGSIPASLQVIDPAGSPEIPLAETVYLSGIGMVDGRLHVQLHFVNHRKTTLGEYLGTVSYRPDETEVVLRDKDSEYWYDDKYLDSETFGNGICGIGWGAQPNDPNTPEWAELVFAADASQLSPDTQELVAGIREIIPIIGTWNVEIPVRLIRYTAE